MSVFHPTLFECIPLHFYVIIYKLTLEGNIIPTRINTGRLYQQEHKIFTCSYSNTARDIVKRHSQSSEIL